MRDTSTSCLLRALSWGPGPQPRPGPWLGIELATSQFTSWCAVHWATPAKANAFNFLLSIVFSYFPHILICCTFISMYFKNFSFETFSLIHGVFKNELFNFHGFRDFPMSFCYWFPRLILAKRLRSDCYWFLVWFHYGQETHCVILVILNLLRVVLWHMVCKMLFWVECSVFVN